MGGHAGSSRMAMRINKGLQRSLGAWSALTRRGALSTESPAPVRWSSRPIGTINYKSIPKKPNLYLVVDGHSTGRRALVLSAEYQQCPSGFRARWVCWTIFERKIRCENNHKFSAGYQYFGALSNSRVLLSKANECTFRGVVRAMCCHAISDGAVSSAELIKIQIAKYTETWWIYVEWPFWKTLGR